MTVPETALGVPAPIKETGKLVWEWANLDSF